VLKLAFDNLLCPGPGRSQTFPEGKGVETPLIEQWTDANMARRRPSQKVKVLKHHLLHSFVTGEEVADLPRR